MSDRLVFPTIERPVVSVVMVTYGQWGWVVRALRALLDHTGPCYELIVVDNASPDGTGEHLATHVKGATIVRADRNLGFGVGNDLAALHARGRYLLLLNSDCLVERAWLSPMLERVETDASVGAVVGKLVDLDGSMQEAGSLIDREAHTLAYRRGADPDDLLGAFPRDVVFGSAGFLLIRREAFVAVGGFDAVFSPAYCEDVDLALALSAAGYRTVYEPRAVARHVREASSASGTSGTLIKAHRPIVQERWAHRLRSSPSFDRLDEHPHRLVAARDALTADRVLVIGAPDRWCGDLARRALRAPTVRWTLVGAVDDPAALANAGVELLADPVDEVDAARRFHYSIVVVGPRASADDGRALLRAQPQARRFDSLDALDDVAELAVANEAGVQPRSLKAGAMPTTRASLTPLEIDPKLIASPNANTSPVADTR